MIKDILRQLIVGNCAAVWHVKRTCVNTAERPKTNHLVKLIDAGQTGHWQATATAYDVLHIQVHVTFGSATRPWQATLRTRASQQCKLVPRVTQRDSASMEQVQKGFGCQFCLSELQSS